MARICEICGKRPHMGNIIWRRGKAKSEGGIGQHVTAVTRRRFFANVQQVRVTLNGGVRTASVCASCLKRGKVVKAPRGLRKIQAAAKAAAA